MQKPKKQKVDATGEIAIGEQIKAFASILISIYLENETNHEKFNTKPGGTTDVNADGGRLG